MGQQSRDRPPQLHCCMAKPNNNLTPPNLLHSPSNKSEPKTMQENYATLPTNRASSSWLPMVFPTSDCACITLALWIGANQPAHRTRHNTPPHPPMTWPLHWWPDWPANLGVLEIKHLEMELSSSIFMLPYKDLHLLAAKLWVKMVWWFQQTHNIWIDTNILGLTISRINNQLLMLVFYSAGFWGADLACLTNAIFTCNALHWLTCAMGQDSTWIQTCEQANPT